MTTLELPLTGARGEPVDLWRTLISHGFAGLAPTALDEEARTLDLTLRLPRGRPRRVRVAQGRPGIAAVTVRGPAPGRAAAERLVAGVRHMLRMDADLSGFYVRAAADPALAWAASGAGRMLRSQTVFEDVVKTICTTNCAWGATVRMVNALVGHMGDPPVGGDGPLTNAFPTAEAMAGAGASFYRDTARAGYRGNYLIAVARAVAEGATDLEALSTDGDLPDEEVERRLLGLPGVGPYAAAHIMMTLGRYSRLILDSWTRPKYARLTGRRSVSDATISRRFSRFGPYAGLAFWLFVTRDWVE